jgi:hypothetical protein
MADASSKSFTAPTAKAPILSDMAQPVKASNATAVGYVDRGEGARFCSTMPTPVTRRR